MRMSLWRSERQMRKGSITVETALVLPLFLFAMLTALYLIESVRFSGNMQAALMQNAKTMSGYAYAAKMMSDGGDDSLSLPAKAVSVVAGQTGAIQYLGKTYIDESPVKGGVGGISFLHSSMLGPDQTVDLIAIYRIKPLFGFFGIRDFIVADRACVRAFTGYDNTKKDDLEKDEEIVFITEKGTVYHRSRNCRHLNVTIRETTKAAVDGERNESGGKYYPCEKCGSLKGAGRLYITSDGDRYHTMLSCSSLKRGVRAVPISEVGNRGACARCG